MMSSRQQAGTLFLVATPIGNLEDITLRALKVLQQVELILAEDTRRTRKLLSHYQIHTPSRSLHEHNEVSRVPALARRLADGAQLALVSDAGMPAISDPGYYLVRGAIEAGATVVPVPGPSAVLAALAASGLPSDRFTFVGYLPGRRGARRRSLAGLQAEPGTLILLESPRRLAGALSDAAEILGERPAVVARELTKVHEDFSRGTLAELAAHFADGEARGEITLCIGGNREQTPTGREPGAKRLPCPEEHFNLLQRQGVGKKVALRRVAREHGLSRRDLYQRLIIEGEKPNGVDSQEDK
ncbi:MAG: 16S rRNA (cytidine(1402)-2'-O)-methyltransferase [Acidobacteriota bacterium]